MTNIHGAGVHEHMPRMEGGQNICQVCRAVLIRPILSSDDERIPVVSARPVDAFMFEALKARCPMSVDMLLIDMAITGNWDDWPDYINQLSERYDEDPPHLLDGRL